jgi:hypothetical protein
VVQTYLLWRHPERFLTYCRRRYGKIFSLRAFPYGRRVDVAGPVEIRRVFKGNPKIFHAGEGIAAALGSMLGEQSLLALAAHGPWRRHRRMFAFMEQLLHRCRTRRCGGGREPRALPDRRVQVLFLPALQLLGELPQHLGARHSGCTRPPSPAGGPP